MQLPTNAYCSACTRRVLTTTRRRYGDLIETYVGTHRSYIVFYNIRARAVGTYLTTYNFSETKDNVKTYKFDEHPPLTLCIASLMHHHMTLIYAIESQQRFAMFLLCYVGIYYILLSYISLRKVIKIVIKWFLFFNLLVKYQVLWNTLYLHNMNSLCTGNERLKFSNIASKILIPSSLCVFLCDLFYLVSLYYDSSTFR